MNKHIEGSWKQLSLALNSLGMPLSTLNSTPSTTPKSHSRLILRRSGDIFRPPANTLRKASVGTHIEGVALKDLRRIYCAKCQDLNLPHQPELEKRFYNYCETCFFARKIVMKDAGIGAESAGALGKLLRKNPPFGSLVLSRNALGDRGLLVLCRHLEENSTLVHLDVSSNDLTSWGIGRLFALLAVHSSITSIDVSSVEGRSRNRIGSKGAKAIEKLLGNPVISMLNLAGTGLGPAALEHLAVALRDNKSLLTLCVAHNEFSGKVMSKFIKTLLSSGLRELDISDNKLGDEGVECIAGHAPCELPLNRLDLARNCISSVGASKLFTGLSKNCELNYLSMEGNSLGEGVKDPLYSCLRLNSTLCHLNLNECALHDEGILGLASALSANKGLSTLLLSSNRIGDTAANVLAIALYRNRVLVALDLSENWISTEGGLALAKAIRFNCTLKRINLRQNHLKDLVGEELVEALRFKDTITALQLEENPMAVNYILKINEYILRNKNQQAKEITPGLRRELARAKVDGSQVEKVKSLLERKQQEELELKNKLEQHVSKLHESHSEGNVKLQLLRSTYEHSKSQNRLLATALAEISAESQTLSIVFEKTKDSLNQKQSELKYATFTLKTHSESLRLFFNTKRESAEKSMNRLKWEFKYAQDKHKQLEEELKKLQQERHKLQTTKKRRLKSKSQPDILTSSKLAPLHTKSLSIKKRGGQLNPKYRK